MTIKIITVYLPLGTPNVTEKESQRQELCCPVLNVQKQSMRDRDGTENSPIKPITGRKEQKQDGQHC